MSPVASRECACAAPPSISSTCSAKPVTAPASITLATAPIAPPRSRAVPSAIRPTTTPISILQPTGPRFSTSCAAVIAVAMLAMLPGAKPARGADAGSVLLPGIDIRSVDFMDGACCRYIVVDEAASVIDSREVYIAILSRTKTAKGDGYWLEIASGPVGSGASERDVARVLVDERVKTMAEGDSLYRYVSRYYIKKGNGPVKAGDVHDLKKLTIVSPTSDRDWVVP